MSFDFEGPTTVATIPGNFDFVDNSTEVDALNDQFGRHGGRKFDAYFVRVGNAEIVEAFGMYGNIPSLDKRLYRVKV